MEISKNLYASRTSIRRFEKDAIPQDLIDLMLRAGIDAPSAGNCQPWHFYVVRNQALKSELSRHAYGQKQIDSAPLDIVVCAEPARSAKRYGERGVSLYCLQDTAAAIENILLCAAENGLGTCWCGAFDETAVSGAMALPEDRRPIAIIAVGYPSGQSNRPKRRPIPETVTYCD